MPMTISRRILTAAGAALALALPAAAEAQQAEEGAKDYPPCSATVTDNCMQHEGGAHAKAAHHARHALHHRMAHKHHS